MSRLLRQVCSLPTGGQRPLVWVVVAVFLVGAAVGGCDLADPVDREQLVVEAFLRTGEDLPAIVLRQTQALSGGGDSAGVRTARATLTLDGERHSYRAASDPPGSYVPADTGVVVPAGVPFEWRVQWRGQEAVAAGRTPEPVAIDSICLDIPDSPSRAVLLDSLRRDSLDIPAEQGYIYPIDVDVRWASSAPDSWVRAQLQPTSTFSSRVVNFFLQPAEVRRERAFETAGSQRTWGGVYAVPVSGEDEPLPRHRLTVALTRGGDEFASFATSRRDPDRREPVSNVDGALGIATAVAVDSLGTTVEPGVDRCQVPDEGTAAANEKGM